MDSLSQIVLGAATFALVKDKEIGKKALLYGAILGTIPDLDILLNPFLNTIEQLAIHRAFSHSIFFSILLSLLCAKWFSYKHKTPYKGWFLASFLALFTHPLLDICTTYGTRIFYPINKSYFALDNVFVIDPLYTIWLLIGCITLLIMKNSNANRITVIKYSLVISTAYLLFGLFANLFVKNHFEEELKRQNIVYEKLKIVPTPFNTIFWQGIVKTKEGIYFSDYSLFDSKKILNFHYEKNDTAFITEKMKIAELDPFFNFTEGFELARKEGDKMMVYGTKFGPMSIENGKAIFIFPLTFNKDGSYELSQKRPDNFKELLHKIFIRVKGN
ncbi:metal-dependent hydrolase [Flavobacterium sp.]|jgi:inner membrane protein|uniref:metal-dependent hydrolase n=1 Tax=Flavobacterium sp. TaxID=239 RepID=UPI002A7F93DA|nr:metal-dependent hydrolase [Flavobacterium sp.]